MPKKTDDERAEIRRNTEAQRDQAKDRAGHNAKRGRKLPTLSELSREIPEDIDLEKLSVILTNESDRSAAIMAAAFLEDTLFVMLQTSLPDWGSKARSDWFEGPNAPFGSFSAKIAFGQACGIYGPATAAILNRIRNIRNCFAHRIGPLDFMHPTIVSECSKLSSKEFLPRSKVPAKTRYCAICLELGRVFIRDANENGGKPFTTRMA